MIDELEHTLRDAIAKETLLLISFSQPKIKSDEQPTKISVRPVDLRGETQYQAAKRIGAQEFHENLTAAEAKKTLTAWARGEFDQVNVFTADADLEFRRRGTDETLRRGKPSRQKIQQQHDKTRQYLIPDNAPCPFLIATGVMTESGKVRSSKQKKFRQINRYLDIVNDVARHLPEDRPIRVVDFGCGRSYLTFALHHLFVNVLGRSVNITGLDLKSKVIVDCQRLTCELNCEGLEFRQGDIAEHESSEPIDLCVSLHACDTATDAAIGKAIDWQASVILAVPCCHHELAGQIKNDDQATLLRHGIVRERFSALATDALRARALDALGYRTQIIEFIDTEHTPKNLMIRAVRKPRSDDTQAALAEYQRFRRSLGIEHFHLEAVTDLLDSE